MDILFILLGVAIFFTAAAVYALDHLEVNPAQAVVSFFIPPFAWWLYFNFWEKSKRIFYSQLVAMALIIGGLVMNVWFEGAPTIDTAKLIGKQKVDTAFVKNYVGSDESLRDLANAERSSRYLNGKIHGKSFDFDPSKDLAEFTREGVLRIKSGSSFHGDVELAIDFGDIPSQSKEIWKRVVRPDTEEAPVIYMSWLEQATKQFKSLKFTRGYSMDITINHEEYNFFRGDLQLVLPDAKNSYLVGSFPLYTSSLRFHGEGLIKDHDSNETLEVIATQTLINTYKKYVRKVFGFQNTSYDYRIGSGQGKTTVYLLDHQSRLRELNLSYYKNDNGWFLDVKGLKDELKSNKGVIAKLPRDLRPALVVDSRNIGETLVQGSEVASESGSRTAVAQNAGEAATTPDLPETQQLQTTQDKSSKKPQTAAPLTMRIDIKGQEAEIPDLLRPLFDKDVELTTLNGKLKQGVYVGVHRKQLVLESMVGGGVIEFLTEYDNIEQLKVLNSPDTRPQVVDFYSPAEN